MSKEYDNDERPSWRDIDKKRDRSSHVGREKQELKEPAADRWNTGRHKKALERLLMGDKGTPEHEKLYKKIHKSYGAPAFPESVRTYVEKYGPPDDVSTLLLSLDTRDVPPHYGEAGAGLCQGIQQGKGGRPEEAVDHLPHRQVA